MKLKLRYKGGKGSGNFGHAGILGHLGGSASGSGNAINSGVGGIAGNLRLSRGTGNTSSTIEVTLHNVTDKQIQIINNAFDDPPEIIMTGGKNKILKWTSRGKFGDEKLDLLRTYLIRAGIEPDQTPNGWTLDDVTNVLGTDLIL